MPNAPIALRPLSLGKRVTIAVCLGVVACFFAYVRMSTDNPPFLAYDFTWGLRGARALLHRQNPYDVIRPTGLYPFDAAFKYPLPYAVLSLPFAWLSPVGASALFGGVGVALFAFALLGEGLWRLPLLASGPALATLIVGQSSLWVAAAALMPALAWMGFCVKPTSAIIGFAYRPESWRPAIAGTLIAGALTMLLVPTWPIQWVHAMVSDPTTHYYVPAIRILPIGPLLLLAAFRWRTAEGRVILTAAIVPQAQLFYSAVWPLLLARNYRQCLAVAVISDLGWIGWSVFDAKRVDTLDPGHQAPWVMVFVYLPALFLLFYNRDADTKAA